MKRSKKTLATHPPSAAEAANQAKKKAGQPQYLRGRPSKTFDWTTVTPVARADAIAAYHKKLKARK